MPHPAPSVQHFFTLPALAMLATLVAIPAPAQAATAKCPATFRVLHNDQIGNEAAEGQLPDHAARRPAAHLPAGIEAVHAVSAGLRRAPGRWLDGERPHGDVLETERGRFTVKRVARPTGTGGGSHPSGNATQCPTFRVLHNDRIGSVNFPKGTYRMTALGGLTCAKSSMLFRDFLQQTQGDAARPLAPRVARGPFSAATRGRAFRSISGASADVAVGGAASAGGASTWVRAPGGQSGSGSARAHDCRGAARAGASARA